MIDSEYIKLERVLCALENFIVIKKLEIGYINDDTEKIKTLIFDDSYDFFGII